MRSEIETNLDQLILGIKLGLKQATIDSEVGPEFGSSSELHPREFRLKFGAVLCIQLIRVGTILYTQLGPEG